MSRRIDFYDDPKAPAANSLVPSVNVIVVNGEGSILLIQRTDNGNWAPPAEPSTSASPSLRRPSARRSRNRGSSARSLASSASTQTQGT